MRLILFLLVFLLPLSASAETIAGRATVIDGDTLEIHGERMRILDIDAPERGQLCFKKLQSIDEGAWPCGLQAALALSGWQTVTCETTKQEMTELSKTWLAHCTVAGQDVAEWLAANGWAVPDRKPVMNAPVIRSWYWAAGRGVAAGSFASNVQGYRCPGFPHLGDDGTPVALDNGHHTRPRLSRL